MNFRIAFASTGEYIDQHFGSARYFQIYDIAGNEHHHVETRTTGGKGQSHCEGGFNHFLEILNDCDAVFIDKIGPGAAAFMIAHGKRVFEASGKVEDIIAKLTKEKLLAD